MRQEQLVRRDLQREESRLIASAIISKSQAYRVAGDSTRGN